MSALSVLRVGLASDRLARARILIGALTVSELKERGGFSPLGIAKWLIEPISYMYVYFLLVGVILKNPQRAFPLFLLAALVPWRYFSVVVSRSMGAIQAGAPIILNRSFPLEILPLVVVLAEGAILVATLPLFIPIMAFYGVGFDPMAVLWLPVVALELGLLTAGPAYLFAVIGLYLPQQRSALQNLIRMGFFVSAGLVPLEDVSHQTLKTLLALNPLTPLFESFRAIFWQGRVPAWSEVAYPLGAGLVLTALGVMAYRARKNDFARKL